MGHILEHVAIELQNVAGEPVTFGKTRGAGADGPLPRHLPVRAGGRGARGRAAGHHAAPLAAAARAPARRRGPGRLRLRRRAGRVHPVRPAAGAGAEHHVAGARGGGAADPLDPAQRAEPDPVRARPVPAADPGHGHQPHARTSRSSSPPTRRRPTASSPTWACRCRSSAWCSGTTTRWPRRSGSAIPVVVKPYNANHGRGISIHLTTAEQVRDGVRGGPRAQPQRDRRELHHRRGPPHAGHQRRAGGGLQAGARARGGRRESTPSSSWSTR